MFFEVVELISHANQGLKINFLNRARSISKVILFLLFATRFWLLALFYRGRVKQEARSQKQAANSRKFLINRQRIS